MSGRFLQSATVRAIMGTAALAALNGCATFGSNVKGSFSCTAPDGICAPSASIDDRALAMIAGDSGAADVSPAGPYMESKPRLKTARPAAVGSIPRVPRRNSGVPTSDSSLRIWTDNGGCAMRSRTAARPTLRSSATATK